MKKKALMFGMFVVCILLMGCSVNEQKRNRIINAVDDILEDEDASNEESISNELDKVFVNYKISEDEWGDDKELANYFENVISDLYQKEEYEKLCSLLSVMRKNSYENEQCDEIENCLKNDILGLLNKADCEQLLELLDIMENSDYKSETIQDTIKEYFSSSQINFAERVNFAKKMKYLIYYSADILNKEIIENYIAENEETIYTQNGKGGYYDEWSNRNEKKVDEFEVDTYSYEYFGDFAIETWVDEYLDEYYQIKHKTRHYLYFRGWKLSDADLIDKIHYAAPYLFCEYDNEIQIYELDSNETSLLPYTVEIE